MRALTAAELIEVWEQGREQHPVTAALIPLAAALPRKSWRELAALGIGERDRLLLELREKLFGSSLHGLVGCPKCAESLEINLTTTKLLQEGAGGEVRESYEIVSQGVTLLFRIPASDDLLRIGKLKEVGEARRVLAESCLLGASRDGRPVDFGELSERNIHDLAEGMAKCDPQVELLINLTCPECANKWVALFDIAAYFRSEISAQARRLIADVHTLARAYGWSEADILAMSARRRHYYLEKAG